MWKSIILGLVSSALFGGGAFATSCTSYPNPLTNGTTANGSDVIGDLTYMSGCLAPLASPTFSGTTTFSTSSGNTIVLDRSGGAAAAFFESGAAKFLIEDDTPLDSSLAFYYWNGGSWSNLVNFKTNGDVGIGTTTPGYTLHVNGSVAGTSAYNNLSDARLKKDVRPILGALDLVEKLHGVRFLWKDPRERTVGRTLNLPAGQNQVGFIAQDLEKVLPEAVSTAKGPEAIKSVAESKVVPVLVEAVKELKAANDNQAAQLENLKKEMALLEGERSLKTAAAR